MKDTLTAAPNLRLPQNLVGEENQGIRITRTVAPLILIVGIVPLVPLRLVGLMVIIPPRVAVPQVGGTLLAVVEVILPAVMMTTMMTRTNLPPPVVEVAVLRVGLPAPAVVAAHPPVAVLVVAPVPVAPVMVPAVAPQVAVVAVVAEAAVDPALVAKTRRQAKTAAAAAPRKHPAPKPPDQPKTQPVIRPRPAVSPIKSRRKNPPTATGHPTAASSTRLHKMKKSPQPRTRYHTLGSSLGVQSCLLA